MASNIHIAAVSRKGMLDGAVNLKTDANSGKLVVYSGTQPVDCDTATSGNTALAVLTMNATAFSAASGTASTDQTLTAGAITSDTSAPATGTATWFRLYKSDHTTGDNGTHLVDGTVGTSGADMNLTGTVSIVTGNTVACSSMTLTLVK